ncbi:hypothetical protein AOLI_G00330790, partial [Acnodon oligacanthus]
MPDSKKGNPLAVLHLKRTVLGPLGCQKRGQEPSEWTQLLGNMGAVVSRAKALQSRFSLSALQRQLEFRPLSKYRLRAKNGPASLRAAPAALEGTARAHLPLRRPESRSSESGQTNPAGRYLQLTMEKRGSVEDFTARPELSEHGLDE